MSRLPALSACLFLLPACAEPDTPRWIPLSGTATGATRAQLVDGRGIELLQLDGELWGEVEVRGDAWQRSDFPGFVHQSAPLLGLGRPLYSLEIEGKPCPPVAMNGENALELMRHFEPGTFGAWRDSIFLGLAPGATPPATAKLRVRLDTAARDAEGFHQVLGRRFSGRGLTLWPGQRIEITLDVPEGSALSFGTCIEAASALAPSAGVQVFRVRFEEEVVLEHSQACSPGGSYARHSVALPARRAGRLVFEVEGPFAYTTILDPVVGPAARGTYAERPWPAPPSIVVFLADTFRADNLASYGGAAGTTPELDRFAAESLRFARAWSVGTFTLPGHAALFSGLYPHQTSSDSLNKALPAAVDTIAEVLARNGYRTGAITDSVVLSLRFGLHQGFEWFDELDVDLASTLERARRFLDADDGRPVFLFVHTYRVHLPYRAEEPPGPEGRPSDAGYEEYKRLMGGLNSRGGPEAAMARDPASARPLVEELEELYRRGAHDLDRGFGEFWRDLRARGFPRAGFVLFTSDHGEAFFEHGQLAHQGRVFEEQIRIPLLITGPGVTPRTVEQAASLVDLSPTLAAMAAIAPLAHWQGTNLLGLERERPLFAFECASTELSTVAILSADRKLIALEEPAAGKLRKPWQAYDLASDPGETRDLLAGSPWTEELFRTAAPVIDALLVPFVAGEASQLDPDKVDELEALGYTAR